jgi:murein DD-endopeptidase MepM/ murein hydrolase activator NlpD
VGDRVTVGERLGEVGRSGNAQGCHLHFEVWSPPGWERGVVRDPFALLRRWTSRASRSAVPGGSPAAAAPGRARPS